jgi:hypothetical protein
MVPLPKWFYDTSTGTALDLPIVVLVGESLCLSSFSYGENMVDMTVYVVQAARV